MWPNDTPETFRTADTMAPRSADAPASDLPGLPARYEDHGVLASGAMGEVRRVRDTLLDQFLALKITLRPLARGSSARARFLLEARITARLAHPAIVSVHDLGELPDGRLWFTMREVRGRTLGAVIGEAHAGAADGTWSFQRVMTAFETVCNTVAYAHEQQVIHRDLKPGNIMVGEFGEVQVMDWGLARDLTADDVLADASTVSGGGTVHGTVLGTPAYMSPEQARGEIDRHSPASDVYALGAILYQALCGEAPFPRDAQRAWRQVLAGPPVPLSDRVRPGGMTPPADLVSLVERCMARDPRERPPTATPVAEDVRVWLDGARRRQRALRDVAEAAALEPQIAVHRAEADRLRTAGDAILAPLPPFADEASKRPGWALLEQADAEVRQSERIATVFEQTLHAALRRDPTLGAARDMLADHYQQRMADAEQRRDVGAATQAEVLLRAYDRGRHRGWLRGDGVVTLHTTPPGAIVDVYRYEPQHRRQVPVHVERIGPTPLVEHRLARGSHLLVVSAPGHAPVHYPVHLRRGEHGDGIRPGGDRPLPIVLPRDAPHRDDVWVPAGWFVSGGDPDAVDGLPRRRLWVDGFAIQRTSVTNAAYLAFLDDLVRSGRPDEATAWAAKDTTEATADRFVRRPDGSFALGHTAEGRPLDPAWPVVLVSWEAARAYAAWTAGRDGLPWRLPHDQEWEKAARGVDARSYPWGDHLDPTWVNMVRSSHRAPALSTVDAFPLDVSVYGVRGMAGNNRDWCANRYRRGGPPDAVVEADPGGDDRYRMMKGGFYSCSPDSCRVAGRWVGRPTDRMWGVGVRLVRSTSLTPARGPRS